MSIGGPTHKSVMTYQPDSVGTFGDNSEEVPGRFARWSGQHSSQQLSASTYVYVERQTSLSFDGFTGTLRPGMFARLPGEFTLDGGGGVVASWGDVDDPFLLGGPAEETGRLRYIDGCTDSLLLAPSVFGRPCLNLLHLPAGTDQTEHTHPSYRLGVVASGAGVCYSDGAAHALHAGVTFVIPDGTPHRFVTTRVALRIIAFHPDSDFGPTDEVHPMRNRTIVAIP